MRKKVIGIFLIGTMVFFTGCDSESTTVNTSGTVVIEEQVASVDESEDTTESAGDATLDSSESTEIDQEVSDVPLYDRTYLVMVIFTD